MSGQGEQRFRNTLIQRENDKIEKVEKKTVRLIQLERSESEKATQTGFVNSLLRQELAQQREAKMGHVALILVRREALRRVLEEEKELYAKELSLKGLAIYQQRI